MDDTLDQIVQKIDSLEPNELANWLRARLGNRDTLLRTRDREPAHYLIATVYPHLKATTQSNLSRAALQMFREIANPSRPWATEPAAALLRMVDPLLIDSLHKDHAIEALLQLVDVYPASHEIAFAAVQGLVALGYKSSPRYWAKFLESDARYAPIALEAMARTNFRSLQDWLLRILPNPAMERAFVQALPLLSEDKGGDVIMSLSIAVEPYLSETAIERIKKFAAHEGLTPTTTTDDLLFSHFIQLVRCTDSMLRAPTQGRSIDTIISAFAYRARLYRKALRQRRDRQKDADRSLCEQWDVYVGILEYALERDEFHDVALTELIDSLEDVDAASNVAGVREHIRRSRGQRFSSEQRQQIVASLDLTSSLRMAREAVKRQHRDTGPSESLMQSLAEL
jgi:hypothetical protein